MPASQFQMDPQATSTGLTTAGQVRSQAVDAAIPALPAGTYVGGYSTAAATVLAALTACQRSCQCTGGMGSNTSAVSVRARGDAMQVSLRPAAGQQLDVFEIYRCLRRALVERERPLAAA